MIKIRDVGTRMVVNCCFCGSNAILAQDNRLMAARDFEVKGWTTKTDGTTSGPCCPKCSEQEKELVEVF